MKKKKDDLIDKDYESYVAHKKMEQKEERKISSRSPVRKPTSQKNTGYGFEEQISSNPYYITEYSTEPVREDLFIGRDQVKYIEQQGGEDPVGQPEGGDEERVAALPKELQDHLVKAFQYSTVSVPQPVGCYGSSHLPIPKLNRKKSPMFDAPYLEPSARTDVEYGELLPELESRNAKIPSEIEMFDQVRSDFRIFRTTERTLIYAVVVDMKQEQNKAVAIRCFGGVSFGGYVRDCSGDAYLIECVESVHLGAIPFSFRIEVPKSGNWSVNIPIPEKVLESSFAPKQRKTLLDIRERFSKDRYEIHYLQMLLAN